MREGEFLSLGPHGFHRVAFTDWGDADNPRVVVCVHGLTRNGRDFDTLARALAPEYRVVCPDVAGRGRSEWLPIKQDYAYPLYCSDMAALLAHIHATSVSWVGTSMGGIIGMLLAAMPATPLQRMVVNDIGPFIPKAAIERLRGYVGNDPRFASFEELLAYVRTTYAGFGLTDEAEWRSLAEVSGRRLENGAGWALAYDPGIATLLRSAPAEDQVLWQVWDRIRCPVLVLHGEESDLLLPQTVEEMRRRHPETEIVHLPGVGHAPSLMSADQVERVVEFLRAGTA